MSQRIPRAQKPPGHANGDPTPPDGDSVPENPALPITTLTVWRPCVNPHLLICHLPDADPEKSARLFCRVQSNVNFLPGMEVPARHLGGEYYECVRGMPRRKGHW